jgi:ABC-type phosphate transport system substrate-binding protein
MPLIAAILGQVRSVWLIVAITVLGTAGIALVRPLTTPAEELKIVGSRAMQLPVESWLVLYRARHPNSRVHAALYGSGLAAGAIADRRADAAPMIRKLNPAERAILPQDSLPIPIPVGRLPLASGHAPLFIYVARDPSGRASPSAVAFASIALSTKGQSEMVRAGFEPLPLDRRDVARRQLSALADGSAENDQ